MTTSPYSRLRRLAVGVALALAVMSTSSASAAAPSPERAMPLAVSAGDGVACALVGRLSSGYRVPMCWGSNANGQLATQDRSWIRPTPTPMRDIRALDSPAAVSVGMQHWCSVVDATVAYGCMGDHSFDQTGNPFPDYSPGRFTQVSAGGFHTCAIRVQGSVWCWGRNNTGQLGTGGTATSNPAPAQVAVLTQVSQVSAGGFHTCAIAMDGVWCWGANNLLQSVPRSGRNDDTSRTRIVTSPTRVPDGDGAVEVAAGGNHTCARWATGTVRCWGYNDRGQLGSGGLGGNIIRGREIAPVALPAPAMAISAGDKHSCAILTTTEAYCWGYNGFGQLGNGRGGGTSYDGVPQRVGNLRYLTAIDAGWGSTCAVSKFGGLWCWGRGEGGQLGNDTSGSGKWSSTPQAVVGYPDSNPATLTVQIDRPDLGRVVTEPSFINCASAECSADFAMGRSVRLTARAIPGAELAGWEGACSGTDDDCVVAMNQATTVRAIFRFPLTHTLSLTFTGDTDGIGTPVVLVDPADRAPTVCVGPASCEVPVTNGASVVLRADPGSENVFRGWSGACAGTDDSCVLAMDRDQSAGADMPLRPTVRMTAEIAGNAPGSVEDTASGLWCRTPELPSRPNRCAVDVARGTPMSFVTTPLIGGDTAFGGPCATTVSPCAFAPRRSLRFTTTFRAASGHAVTVTRLGNGRGEVVGPGIACGRDCASDGTLASPYAATYTATPATGSIFVRWEGPICSGTNATCQASMPGPISAVFAVGTPPPTAVLAVAVRGTGRGRVTSAPGGINCNGACSATFRTFDTVTLTAVPEPGSRFDRWSGACEDTDLTCTIPMDASRRATAVFSEVSAPPMPTPAPTPGPAPAPQVLPEPGPNPASGDAVPPPPTALTLTNVALRRATLPSGGSTRVAYSLSRSANVLMTFRRPGARKPTYRYRVRSGGNGADAGRNSVLIRARVKGRNVRPGRWEMTIAAQAGAVTTKPVRRTIVVRAR